LEGKEFLDEFKAKVPILDKARVKEDPDSFLVRRPAKIDLEFYTSGSTGKPMKAYISWRHWVVEQAVIYRHWKWHGYSFRDTCAMLRSYSPKEGEPLIKYSWALNTFYYSPFHMDDTHMEEYYHHMRSKKVKYLRGYPSSIKIFAEFCQKKAYTIPGLKFILTASEVLSDDDRSFIENVFGVQIGNHYGLAEQIVMFGNCSESSILHNYNEYGYCELIPTDKVNIFRIIGTNLHNDLMPLLRYDTGDLAYARPGVKCPCGRAGIQVEAIIGRNDVLIKDSNGSSLPTVNFYTMMQYYTTIKEWQFIIKRTDDFVLAYTGIELGKIESAKLLTQLKDRLANTKLTPEIKNVKSLKKISEGKTPRVIYEN
jgi:phenylacetate-CoA ligase